MHSCVDGILVFDTIWYNCAVENMRKICYNRISNIHKYRIERYEIMKFTKIDENTVRCVISKEEMESYNLEIEDFIKKNKKVKDFVELLIDKAGDEVGYEHSNGMMQLQLQPLPKMGLAITFSSREITPEELSKEIAIRLGEEKAETFLDTVSELIGKEKKGKSDEATDSLKKKNTKVKKTSEEIEIPDLCICKFSNLSDIGAFCGQVPEHFYVKGSLYKDENDNAFYMAIERARCKKEKYLYVCRLALEFSYLDSSRTARFAFLNEQCTCIVRENAFSVFRKIYKK